MAGFAVKYCENCGEKIRDKDLQSGDAVEVFDKSYCANCKAEYMQAMGGAAPAPAAAPVRQGGGDVSPRRSTARRRPQQGTGNPAPLIAGAVLAVVVLALAASQMGGGGDAPEKPPQKTKAPPERPTPPVERAETPRHDEAIDALRSKLDRLAKAEAMAPQIAKLRSLVGEARALLDAKGVDAVQRKQLQGIVREARELGAERHLRLVLAPKLERHRLRCEWSDCAALLEGFPSWLTKSERYRDQLQPQLKQYVDWAEGTVEDGELPWIEDQIDFALVGKTVERWAGAKEAKAHWTKKGEVLRVKTAASASQLSFGSKGWIDYELRFEFKLERNGFELRLRNGGEKQDRLAFTIDGGHQAGMWYETYVRVAGADVFHKTRRLEDGRPLHSAARLRSFAERGRVTFRAGLDTRAELRSVRYRVQKQQAVDGAWVTILDRADKVEHPKSTGACTLLDGGIWKMHTASSLTPNSGSWGDLEWEFRMRRLKGKFGVHPRFAGTLPRGGYFQLTDKQAPVLTTDKWSTIVVRYQAGKMYVKLNGREIQFGKGRNYWAVPYPEKTGRPLIRQDLGSAEYSRIRIRKLGK